jgi:hypothetical protein
MQRPCRRSSIYLAVFILGCHPGPDAPVAGQPKVLFLADFDRDTGSDPLPAGWSIAETEGNGTPATWGLVASGTGSAFAVKRSNNAGRTFNLAILQGVELADFQASVRVQALGGSEDQGGGLCWRLRGPNEYYVARWNPLETNLRLYHVVGGKRTMLATADVTVDGSQWHLLGVEAKGDSVRVSLDGRWLIEHSDRTFAGAGRFGLWTKADARTAFDELRIW